MDNAKLKYYLNLARAARLKKQSGARALFLLKAWKIRSTRRIKAA